MEWVGCDYWHDGSKSDSESDAREGILGAVICTEFEVSDVKKGRRTSEVEEKDHMQEGMFSGDC